MHELIIVTFFWADSPSRDDIKKLLIELSGRALNRGETLGKIRVRICLSSRSLTQKLFHTTSLNGHVFPPKSWTTLGLPAPEELGGLDLVVKSIFVRPFSVMHPKFVLMDRSKAWFPSCNVSWESWFEGSIELEGPITNKLFDFWRAFWGREGGGMSLPPTMSNTPHSDGGTLSAKPLDRPAVPKMSNLINCIHLRPAAVETILLPSPHHRNPLTSTIPSTPLNLFMLTLIETAKRNIWMQTPNLTCRPVVVCRQS